jgi:hypothetical protein
MDAPHLTECLHHTKEFLPRCLVVCKVSCVSCSASCAFDFLSSMNPDNAASSALSVQVVYAILSSHAFTFGALNFGSRLIYYSKIVMLHYFEWGQCFIGTQTADNAKHQITSDY